MKFQLCFHPTCVFPDQNNICRYPAGPCGDQIRPSGKPSLLDKVQALKNAMSYEPMFDESDIGVMEEVLHLLKTVPALGIKLEPCSFCGNEMLPGGPLLSGDYLLENPGTLTYSCPTCQSVFLLPARKIS